MSLLSADSLDEYLNAEWLEGSCCVQSRSNVLWKLAAVLIDILWRASLPRCWYRSSADSGPLLYWRSHQCSLWSTKEMKKRKETSLANQHVHTRTQAVCLITFSHFLSHLCISVHTLTENKLRLIVASGDTHTHTHSLKLQHKASQCCSSGICTVRQGHWYM